MASALSGLKSDGGCFTVQSSSKSRKPLLIAAAKAKGKNLAKGSARSDRVSKGEYRLGRILIVPHGLVSAPHSSFKQPAMSHLAHQETSGKALRRSKAPTKSEIQLLERHGLVFTPKEDEPLICSINWDCGEMNIPDRFTSCGGACSVMGT